MMQPNQNPNIQPQPSVTPEQQPTVQVPEVQPLPVAPEVVSSAVSSDAAAPITVPAIPVMPAAPAVPVPGAAAPVQTTPAIADDVDVIEKEWVDQADKVVKSTSGDPYAEEEAVESLQVDYLKKRYGHDVKKPGPS